MKKHLLLGWILAHLCMSGVYASTPFEQGAEVNSFEKELVSKDLSVVKAGIQNQPVRFTENKGQITDMDGKPVPFVLFSAEAPGMSMYITEKGLTYVFNKAKEKSIDQLNVFADNPTEPVNKIEEVEHNKIEWNRIDMALAGASIKAENIIKEGMSASFSQYFLAHCPDGISDVHSYEKITIKEIYPGIDWVFYNSSEKGFKYDFIVHPGANPHQIELLYSSLLPLELDKTGNINLQTEIGTITENAPYSYISASLSGGNETSQDVASQFQITDQKQIIPQTGDAYYQTSIGFNLGSYVLPLGSTLIIDPQLFWATFFGGENSDAPMSITTDVAGNVYVTGNTISPNFPIQNAGIGAYQGAYGGQAEAFIMKFSNAGVLLWSTFYGGINADAGYSIATDLNGNVFVAGYTQSINFPVQNSGTFFQGATGGDIDVFILKFDNAGNRLWATYYGGTGYEVAYSIALDGSGNLYLTGESTTSTSFPLQSTGTFFQGVYAGGLYDAFILKFDNAGNRLWATYYGGVKDEQGASLAIDGNGNIFVTGYTTSTNFPIKNAGTYFQSTLGGGRDVFILKFDKFGNRLWSTYYGGKSNDSGTSIKTDQSGNIFVSGGTGSIDFPLKDAGTFFQSFYGGGGDAFILKFDNVGNRLWATYYGSSLNEFISSNYLAVDSCGTVYMTFSTSSNDVLTKALCDGGYFNGTYNGGISDQFITRFSNKGTLLWATFLGGEGFDFRSPITLDNAGNLFVTGQWAPSLTAIPPVTYPLTNPGGGAYYSGLNNGSDDGFIVKFNKIPIVTSIVANANCGCASTATANTSGGCAPYTYLWSDGQTTQTATGLCAGNYTVMVTDTIACNSNSASVTITPLPTPTSTFTVTSPVCVGVNSNITYTGNATTGAVYTWDFDNGNLASGTDKGPYAINWATPGIKNITLSVTQGGCTSSLGTQSITVNPSEDGSFNYSSGTFCPTGANPIPTIASITGGTFTSSPAGLIFVSTTTGEINLAASSLNTYTITYTTAGPCPNSTSANITITNTPVATFSYSGPYCQNAANPSPVFSGGGSSGIFSSTAGLVFVNTSSGQIDLNASTPGTYAVTNNIAASGACAAASATDNITITSLPIANFSYTGSPFCQDAVNPSPDLSGGTAGTFTSTSGLVFVNTNTGQVDLLASLPGTYTVTNTISASGGCPIVAATTNITITALQDAGFNYSTGIYCTSGSNPIPTITGIAGGIFTSSPAGLTFVSSSTGEIDLAATAINTYSISYTTVGPCANTSTVFISVKQAAAIALTSATGTDAQVLCINIPITPITYSIIGGITGAIVSGLPAGISSTFVGDVFTISGIPTVTGIFNYTVTATGTCTPTSASGSINVNPIPVITSVTFTDESTCNAGDGTITINATGTGLTYSINGGSSFVPTNVFNGLIAGNYSVEVKNSFGCLVNGGVTTINSSDKPVAPTANVSPNPICVGSTLTLSVAAPVVGETYTWSCPRSYSATGSSVTIPNITIAMAGFYTVTASAGACVITGSSVNVIVNPNAAIALTSTAGTDAQTLCFNSPIIPITYSVTGIVSGATVNGLPNGVTGSLSGNVFTINGTPNIQGGPFSYTINTSGTCNQTSTQGNITIKPIPETPTAFNNSPVCEGELVNVTASTIAGALYSWTGPNGFVSTQQNLIFSSITATQSGIYSVAATVDGCTGKAGTTTVIVNPFPEKPTILSNSPLCEGLTLDLTSSTINGAFYFWTGPNNFSSSQQFPSISSVKTTASGKYYLATTVAGCTVKDSIVVTVLFCDELTGGINPIEAFSPNGDGVNDIFMPITKNLKDYKLQIFNRWGEKIFETTDSQKGWDGQYAGEIAVQNMYVFLIQAQGNDGKLFNLSGMVTLVK